MVSERWDRLLTLTANMAVVVGIVVLVIEVREARRATEFQTTEGITEGWFALNEPVFQDAEYTRTYLVGLYRPEDLDTVEAARFSMYVRMFANHVERIGRHQRAGLVTDDEYQAALYELATLLSTPGGRIFRESDPSFDEELADRLRPFEGSEPSWDLILGRDPSSIQ